MPISALFTVSDHFDGRHFFNPSGAAGKPFWQVPRLLLASGKTEWPRRVDNPRFLPPPQPEPGQVVVTHIGHASFLLQTRSGNVLTDPVYAKRASPVQWAGPKRVRAPGLALEALPEIKAVLVSHNHYDHMDMATLRYLEQRFHPLFLTGLGNARPLKSRGLKQVVELDWWQRHEAGELQFTMTPAQHFSARGVFDRNRTLWGGFLMEAEQRKVYFAGDSAYAGHFREIRDRLGSPDLAMLPIGAYDPEWFMQEIHMNPEEAVQAHLDLGARQSVAMHYGVFQLTFEAIDEPVQRLTAKLQQDIPAEQFRALGFGESLRISAPQSITPILVPPKGSVDITPSNEIG